MPAHEDLNGVAPSRMNYQIGEEPRVGGRFPFFLGVFTAIYILSWPVLFSLDLWILKDRGSFLNLDYLIDQHLRLGVDTFYSYGLLPVLIQHWLFVLCGRGYWPLIGCAIATMVLMAFFCARFLRYLPGETIWLVAILAMNRIVNPVNPNLPYSLVQLSLLFALLFVLIGKLDISLAISAIGCWSVPSLPLVMTATLGAFIILDWLLKPPRSFRGLLREFAPGVLTYSVVAVLLSFQFGWHSVFATATPREGMSFYKQVNYGSSQALMEFLHPWGYRGLRYIVYTLSSPVSWWVMSTACLTAFAILAARRMVIRWSLVRREMAIVLCALIQGVFACIAYGAPHQHYIFDPILVVGMLLGLSALSEGFARNLLVIVFLGLGVAGQATLAHADWQAWKQIKSPSVTANLYADRDWVDEWKKILELSTRQSLLFLLYSTGAHYYFPTVHSPEIWTLQKGQLLVADKVRVMQQLNVANVVVLDLTSPTTVVDTDADFKSQLHSLCLTQSTADFQVWWQRSSKPDNLSCLADPRR